MLSQANVRIVVLMMLLAIILAIAGSLAFSSRNRATEEAVVQTPMVVIDDVQLRVLGEPEQRVRLTGDVVLQSPITIPAQDQPTTTEQLEAPTPVPTAVPVVATAVPITNTPAPQGGQPVNNSTIPPVIFESYTVQPGDTLYSITSARVATSIGLMAQHNISAEDIVAGNVIQLPKGNPDFCPGYRPYAVGEGDTAFSVARRFGTNHDNLRAINNLDANYTIRIAQIICVP